MKRIQYTYLSFKWQKTLSNVRAYLNVHQISRRREHLHRYSRASHLIHVQKETEQQPSQHAPTSRRAYARAQRLSALTDQLTAPRSLLNSSNLVLRRSRGGDTFALLLRSPAHSCAQRGGQRTAAVARVRVHRAHHGRRYTTSPQSGVVSWAADKASLRRSYYISIRRAFLLARGWPAQRQRRKDGSIGT